eukprot:m.16650 g.16650  ORF g.16650 m.16650 type:complete len:1047 (+) comp27052_c0_seq3:115-3255(+)
MAEENRFHVVFELILVGDDAVRNNAILSLFIDRPFYSNGVSGNGRDVRVKILEHQGKRIALRIWELGAANMYGRFHLINNVLHGKKMGIVLTFGHFESVYRWLQVIDKSTSLNAQVVLWGTVKTDDGKPLTSELAREKIQLKVRRQTSFFEALDSGVSQGDPDELLMALVRSIENTEQSSAAEKIYQKAVQSGGVVPVVRSRLVVVGPDGAGKTSFVDSLLGRPFKKNRPSTDGVAIDIAITEADQEWQEEAKEGIQYIDKHIARAVYEMELQEDDTTAESVVGVHDSGIENTELPAQPSFPSTKPPIQQKDTNSVPPNSQTNSEIQFGNDPEKEASNTSYDLELTEEQKDLLEDFRGSYQRLKRLKTKHIWDLGGQETYLSTHSALMSVEGKYAVTAYALVFDLSRSLNALAKSRYIHENGQMTDLTHELGCVRLYGDFLRHWLTSLQIAHPGHVSGPYTGKNERVASPPVFGVATHADAEGAMQKLAEQSRVFAEIVEEMKYEGHLIDPKSDGKGGLFLIRNTLSSQCPGVRAFQRRVDAMDDHYWTQQDSMPVRWLPFEQLLISWQKSKVLYLQDALEIGLKRCAIPSKEEVVVILQYLHNLGVILFFSTISSLSKVIFVDPTWLVKAIANFVTAKKPSVPFVLPDWRELQRSGEMSPELTDFCLRQSRLIRQEEHQVILDVLKMIDVVHEMKSSKGVKLFIPCMIKDRSQGSGLWEKYDPDGTLPPPIIVQPEGIPSIPESFYFRLVVHFLRKYGQKGKPKLSRNRCSFCLGYRMIFELLYHSRGQCIMATAGAKFSGMSRDQVSQLSEARLFLKSSIANAKRLGMKGLQLTISCQLGKSSTVDGLGEQYVDSDRIVCLPHDYSPRNYKRDLQTKNKEFLSDEELDKVAVWYGLPKAIGSAATSPEQNKLVEKVRKAKCFTTFYEQSEFPEDLLNVVCQSSINVTLLRTSLGIGLPELSRRSNRQNDFEKRRDILEVWIDKNGEKATLSDLFDVVEKGDQLGYVSKTLESLFTQLPSESTPDKAKSVSSRIVSKLEQQCSIS